jgi:membrane protease YdiL (CAAX protease family)
MTKPPPLPTHSISDKARLLEIVAVLLTASGKFVFMDWLQWRLPFIVAAILGWTIYVIVRQQRIPGITQYWGFRLDNFGQMLKLVLPIGVTSVAIFFIIGYYRGTVDITWHIVPILILYPVWGTIQQFLLIALVAGNLKDLKVQRLADTAIIFATAVLFGLLHYPYYWLIAATFILAVFYGYLYLRTRNVYVLGIFHGWLGGLFFYTVVGRDPFEEVFGK